MQSQKEYGMLWPPACLETYILALHVKKCEDVMAEIVDGSETGKEMKEAQVTFFSADFSSLKNLSTSFRKHHLKVFYISKLVQNESIA